MLLENKVALVTGVANDRSIAYQIAKQYKEQGATVILSYVGEAVEDRVKKIAASLQIEDTISCDVSNEEDVINMYETVDKKYGKLDILVHAIAFAPKDELKGSIFNSSLEGFKTALGISSYSLIGLSKHAVPLMEKAENGSIIALTYIGSDRPVPNYNTMGIAKAALESSMRYIAADVGEKNIRVNCISPGPIKTLSARGINGFMDLYKISSQLSLMKKGIEAEDVGGTAVYLASDLSKLVTGNVIFVDGGYHISPCIDENS